MRSQDPNNTPRPTGAEQRARNRPAAGSGKAPQQGQPARPPAQQPQGQRYKPAGAQRVSQRPAPTKGQRPPAPKQPRQRGQSRWFRAIVMVAATIAGCIFLALFALQSASDLFGLNQPDEIIEVTIPQGSGMKEVAKILKENRVIDQSITFRLYLSLLKSGTDEQMQPGKYNFNSNMAYDELIIALRTGKTASEEKRLTFIEGWTMLEIANHLEKNNICDADEFIAFLDNDADYSYEFFGAIENDPLRYHKLEGYLFPDTYDFYIGESVESVARKFIRNFNDKMTTEMKGRMQDLNMTLDEVIILASVIQKEAGESDDMRLVSSVFHNRLNSGGTYPKLQSDVTILYVENDIKPRLQMANQPMYDAYNTYERDGLPVGAICNPGLDAVMAALYPEDTEIAFYFFVTDINMEFYYAATPQQHYQNVATAQKAGGEVHGIDTQ